MAGSNSEISVGWTGGGGIELAVSDAVTLRTEYLFVDLGKTTVTAKGIPNSNTTSDVFLRAESENELHIVRAALSVKLD